MQLRLLTFCFIFGAFTTNAQIYRGIKELKPYTAQLEKLSDQLRSAQTEFNRGYSEMLQLSKSRNDSSLLSFLYILQGSYHYYLSHRDSAIFYFDAAVDVAKKIDNSRLEITANIRRVFCDENDSPALELSRRMEVNFIRSYQINDTINMIYSLNGLGLFYNRMDSSSRAMNYYYNALYLAEESNNGFEEAFILNNMGLMKLQLGYLDSAFADFSKGKKISEKLGYDRLECHLRENIGYYYTEIDSQDLAEHEYIYVLEVGQKLGLKDLELSSLTNLASLEYRNEDYKKSDSLYQQALHLAKTERMFHAISPIYLGHVQLYSKIGRSKEAFALLDSSLHYAEFSSTLEVRLACLQLRSVLFERLGKSDEALKFYKEYTALRDSVDEINTKHNLAELQFRYNDEKKEKTQIKEKNKLLLQLKQNEIDLGLFRQRLFILLSIFIVIVALIFIYYYRLKQKNERQFTHTIVNKLEEERGRIARDLHDGVGQSIIVLKNKFNKLTIQQGESHEHLSENFSEIIEEIRSISRSLIPPELKRLGLKKAIENRLTEVSNSTNLFVTTEIDDLLKFKIEDHHSLRIYRIIQELTTNTIKHSEATAIRLEALKDGDYLTLIYQDNGKGMDRDKWKVSDDSVGLRSILQRISYLNGTIKIEKPKKGFKVIIKLQLN